MNKKRCFIILFFIILNGCSGYKFGSIAHPQIKSIAIAPIKNDDYEPMLSSYLKKALAEQFQFDNSFEVKNFNDPKDPADCILFAKLTNSETIGTGNDTTNAENAYQPANWSVSISSEFVILIPGQVTPLFPKRKVNGSSSYYVYSDNRITKKRGLQQACRNLAKKIVSYTTEAW